MEKSEFLLPLNLADLSADIKHEYCDDIQNQSVHTPHHWIDFRDRYVPPLAYSVFKTLGLTPCLRKMNLFTSGPMDKAYIHLDGDPENPEKFRPFAINWVWGGKTVMRWFKPIESIPKYTSWGEHIYTQFDENQVELECQATITGPTLVNIGKPHQVINASKERRYCFSMCSEENLTWKEITELCYKHNLVRI